MNLGSIRTRYECLYLLALVAACSQSSPSTGLARQPGNWKMVHTVTAFEASGVSGGMADMVAAGQASIGKPDVGGPVCVTAEISDKDTLTERLNEAIRLGPEWKIARSEFKDGKVSFQALMDDPVQGRGTIAINGSLSPIATDLTVTSDVREPLPGKGHIQTVMRQEATRVGDCSPG